MAVAGSVLALSACSAAEDAVAGAVGDAACALARESLGGVETQVRDAADRIGADPAAARRELEAARDALAAAEDSLSGETRQQVAEARAAVERLLEEARQAGEGAVDQQQVEQAQRDLGDAVSGLATIC